MILLLYPKTKNDQIHFKLKLPVEITFLHRWELQRNRSILNPQTELKLVHVEFLMT